MQTIKITTSQNIDIDFEIAGLGDRILARLIDIGFFIVIIILAVIIGVSIRKEMDWTVTIIVLIAAYALLFVFYDLLCETFMNGQSFGKRIMKIRVISLDGNRPSFSQYLLRWLFRIVDFTLTSDVCGLVCVAASDKKQRIGDMVAGTTLIKTEPRTLIDHIAFTPVVETYTPVFNEANRLSDKDIVLLHEVVTAYMETGNTVIVYNAAERIKELLGITQPAEMDALKFLQTIIRDYTHFNSFNDSPLKY
jgi:uncharacterized RDD family membrane protein YckC